MKAAAAPLISDVPIVILVLFLLSQASFWFLHVLRIGGGIYLLYLGSEAWKSGRKARRAEDSLQVSGEPLHKSLFQGVMVNALSPHAYLFWATIAGPIFLEGWHTAPAYGVSFIIGFYGTLIGGFMLFVLLIASVGKLGQKVQYWMGMASAAALFGFALFLITQGIIELGLSASQ